jgi:hypothetical protein
MDVTTAALWALGILALTIMIFFARFRKKGRFHIKTSLGEANAEGDDREDSPPSAGIRIENVTAGKNLRAQSHTGGLELKDVKVKGSIDAATGGDNRSPK